MAAACAQVVLDPSVSAVDAGDYTLPLSACEGVPGGGMDICRVTEGTKIESSWNLIVPSGRPIQSVELDVYYRDIHKTYSPTGKVVTIPWKEFFGAERWDSSHDGEALALLLVTFLDEREQPVLVKFRGIAKIVVTKKTYSRLPIDSSTAAWKYNCKVQMTSAGRSAVSCK